MIKSFKIIVYLVDSNLFCKFLILTLNTTLLKIIYLNIITQIKPKQKHKILSVP